MMEFALSFAVGVAPFAWPINSRRLPRWALLCIAATLFIASVFLLDNRLAMPPGSETLVLDLPNVSPRDQVPYWVLRGAMTGATIAAAASWISGRKRAA
jgi:hypothetical protein